MVNKINEVAKKYGYPEISDINPFTAGHLVDSVLRTLLKIMPEEMKKTICYEGTYNRYPENINEFNDAEALYFYAIYLKAIYKFADELEYTNRIENFRRISYEWHFNEAWDEIDEYLMEKIC